MLDEDHRRIPGTGGLNGSAATGNPCGEKVGGAEAESSSSESRGTQPVLTAQLVAMQWDSRTWIGISAYLTGIRAQHIRGADITTYPRENKAQK